MVPVELEATKPRNVPRTELDTGLAWAFQLGWQWMYLLLNHTLCNSEVVTVPEMLLRSLNLERRKVEKSADISATSD